MIKKDEVLEYAKKHFKETLERAQAHIDEEISKKWLPGKKIVIRLDLPGGPPEILFEYLQKMYEEAGWKVEIKKPWGSFPSFWEMIFS